MRDVVCAAFGQVISAHGHCASSDEPDHHAAHVLEVLDLLDVHRTAGAVRGRVEPGPR